MQHGRLCTDRCPRIINRFCQFDGKYLSYIADAGLNRKTPRQVQQKYDVEVTAVQYCETSRATPSNSRGTARPPIQYRDTCREISQNGWRTSQKI